jgi:hypothetical protein
MLSELVGSMGALSGVLLMTLAYLIARDIALSKLENWKLKKHYSKISRSD